MATLRIPVRSDKAEVAGRTDALRTWLARPADILPLVVLRVAFGALMLWSTARFVARDWVHEFYIAPQFHFTYLGFGWVKPLPPAGMYLVFGLLAGCAVAVLLGWRYRLGVTLFFLLFTYVELLDKSYYLNHYYFISLLSFLLIWLPANGAWSLDARRQPALVRSTVPAWTVRALQVQIGLVYVFAGLAKLTPDWLIHALPLRIWLPAHSDFPLLGPLFDQVWTAYAFSWAGALYDLMIPFLLLWRPTRRPAFAAVVAFHVTTRLLFPIGMFPWIMITATLVFFTREDFAQALRWLGVHHFCTWTVAPVPQPDQGPVARSKRGWMTWAVVGVLPLFFVYQLVMPLRHWAYPGDVHWTEEGYRFAWKVMLVEKTGHVRFLVTETATGRKWPVTARTELTPQQEKQMAFQPDMILQYARHLAAQYAAAGHAVEVRAEAYVSLNGRTGRLLLDPTVNLAAAHNDLGHKRWILP
ncbi:MAG: HTTM domain-containing protein [Caldilineaceae bacterium]|nr:HTTM domain-containing protein [Caldilineaceae bacterium]